MMLQDLLAQLEMLNVRLWVEDGELRFTAPKGVVQGGLRDAIVSRKPEIIAHFMAQASAPQRAPAAPLQEMLWSLCELESDSPTLYIENRAVRLKGSLQVEALQRAVDEVARRQESLRTTLSWGKDNQLEQVIAPARSMPIEMHDMSGADEEAVENLVNDIAWRAFELQGGELSRFALVKLGPEEWILVLSQHHVVTDRWSASILIQELSAVYEAVVAGRPAQLLPVKITYRAHAADQQAAKQTERYRHLLDHWLKTLDGVPELLLLPYDRPYPPRPTHRGERFLRVMDSDTAARLDEFCRRAGVTPFMAVTAAFSALLHRYSGQDCIVLGTPIAGRLKPELETVAGYFANTLALRSHPHASRTFAELVAEIRDQALTAFDHQDMPFGHLVRALPLDRRQSHPPIFQAMIAFQNGEMADLNLGNLALSDYPLRIEIAKYPLMLTVMPDAGRTSLIWEYQTELFDEGTIERMAGHWDILLADAISHPDKALADLEIMSRAESAELLRAAMPMPVPYPRDETVPALFRQQALRVPDRIAVVAGTKSITYAELEDAATALAGRLAAHGVTIGTRVGICLPRSLDTVVSLLAVMKCGAAYVPLDPDYPAERLRYIATDADIALLLAEAQQPWNSVPWLDPSDQSRTESAAPSAAFDATTPAYIMYTSGSTGQPKGVVVPHRGIVRLVKGTNFAPLDENQVFLHLAPLAFDASTLEIWAPLLNGGRLVLAPPARDALDGLGQLIRQSGVTVLWLTSGLFTLMVETDIAALRSVRVLLAGGDALSLRHVNRAIAELPETRLVNGYGPTENTTFTTCNTFARREEKRISIGTPIANTTVHILDAHGRPVPIGVTGELFTGGDGLALGYLNRSDLTAERFADHCLLYGTEERHERLYSTGDLARWVRDPDGAVVIEMLGRRDDQVKIRGFRIEPGEVEAHLGALPGIAEAVVVVQRPGGGGSQLIGYFVANGDHVSPASIRAQLAAILPAYMLPEHLVSIDALPVTPNGKVDRAALAARSVDRLETQDKSGTDTPRTPSEELVAEAWKQVLSVDEVKRTDDFFQNGGHSLLAVRLLGLLRTMLQAQGRGTSIGVRTIFENPVLMELAACIEASDSISTPATGPGPRQLGERDLPLSYAQERLWTLERMLPLGAAYTVPGAFRLLGRLDIPRLNAALDLTLARHRGVSVVFGSRGDAAVQHMIAPQPVQLIPIETTEAALQTDLAEFASQAFDLENGPLIRARLLRLGQDDHVIALALHHLVCDGWSIGILLRDLAAAYEGATLPPLTLQYTDFADWHRDWLRGPRRDRLTEYWRDQLADLPVLDLLTDFPRPAVSGHRGSSIAFSLAAEEAEAICRGHGVTLFTVCVAAFAILLHRHSGQEDFAIGTPVSGRHHENVADIVGFFADNLVLRTPVSGADVLADVIARVKHTVLGAFEHQDLPFTLLVEALNPERRLDVTPLFQAMVAVNEGLDLDLAIDGLETSSVAIDLPIAKYDLSLNLAGKPVEGRLHGSLEFNTDLFSRGTAERLAQHFTVLVTAIAAQPRQTVVEIDLWGPQGMEEPRCLIGQSIAHPVDGGLHRLIAARAKAFPDAVALVAADGTALLSHAELDRRAAHLAGRLRKTGLTTGGRVGVHLRPGPDMPVALLAVLKAGGAYVPLNPAHPAERRAAIVSQAQTEVIISSELLPEAIAFSTMIRPDDLSEEHEFLEDIYVDGEAPAYIMFTSGSTGVPKGVVVPHRAICNHLGWFTRNFELTSADTLVQMTSFDFDASLIELFGPLLVGGRLVLPEAGESDALALASLIRSNGVTLVQAVPSLYQVMLSEQLLAEQPSLRAVLSGGESLSRDLMQRLIAAVPHARVYNLYGPTETCIDALVWECRVDLDRAVVPIGRPVDNCRAYVVDATGRPLAPGLPGELAIAGAGVALGYLGAPELTAATFIPDHFGQGLVYRTGDRARIGPEGIEYLGRMDQQLKVRGIRVETGEIESALATLPGLRECAVLIVDGEVAAAMVGIEITESRIRTALAARLPNALIPTRFRWLDALPRLTSGKTDHRNLTSLMKQVVSDKNSDKAPLTATEREMSEIWAEVLGHTDFGRDDDFFTLGGHSLRAVQIVSRMRARWQVEVNVRDVFENPTVAALALRVDALGTWADAQLPLGPQPRRRLSDNSVAMPVSRAQRSLWFLDQMEGGSAAYNTVSAFLIDGELDIRAAQLALDAIMARHEALRSHFRLDGGMLVQIIPPAMPMPFATDQSPYPDEAETLHDLVRTEAARGFDLGCEPPVRFRLVPLRSGRKLGILTWHHIATDGWSLGVFVREFRMFYDAAIAGRPLEEVMPALTIQHGDYAAWQDHWLTTEAFDRKLAFWRTHLEGAPQTLTLFTDHPRPPRQSFRGATHRFVIDQSVATQLHGAAHQAGASLFMFGLAGFLALLHRWSRQDDILVGTPVANRATPETEALIGFFANTLVLRGRMGDNPSFRDFLGQIRDTALACFANQDVPFERLVDELDPQRSLAHSPLFQVMFNLQNASADALDLSDLSLSQLEIDTGTAKYDLLLTLIEQPDGLLQGYLEYSTDLFEPATAAAIADQYVQLLLDAAQHPETPLRSLSLMPAEDVPALVALCHGPEMRDAEREGAGRGLLHHLFEEQVDRTPDAIAAVFEGETLTYRQLDGWANAVAHQLMAAGVMAAMPVGLRMDRSLGLLAGLLGILKAGGAYVPLDGTQPEARLAFIAQDAGLRHIVIGEDAKFRLPDTCAPIVVSRPDAQPVPRPSNPASHPEDLLYLLYTSGSSGQPKGVRMPHRSLTNLVRWQIAQPTFAAGLRTLQFTTLSFDVATQEIFATWASGGTLVMMPEAMRRDMPAMLAYAADHDIERIFLPFTALRQIAEAWPLAKRRPLGLRELLTAGERLHIFSALRAMAESLPACRLTNQYGPTETHVATALVLPENPADWPESPGIGTAVANSSVYVLGDDGQPLPPGVPGQLWIAGAAVGHGYLNRPDLTLAQFRPDPFVPGRMMYGTGDLACLRADGDARVTVEFHGRIDQQVKIRGFRVEPEEVEHAVAGLDEIAEAAVAAWADSNGEKRLVAYYVAAATPPPDTARLRELLGRQLPDYMVPTSWIPLPGMPLTSSGKIDRRALPPVSATTAMPARRIAGLDQPVSETQQTIAAIWADILQSSDVGLHDNFFDLGGSSFLLLRVLAKIRQTFAQASDIGIVNLFEHPTVSGLAGLIDGVANTPGMRHRGDDRRARLAGRPDRRALRRGLGESSPDHESEETRS